MSLSKVIVGLGNPGRKYAGTRHNLGWRVLDEIVRSTGPYYESGKWCGVLARKGGTGLFKPLTYMNSSGKAVGRFFRALGLDLSDILVVSDDLDLDLGRIRMRPRGSSGGHNGLESVIEHLGSDEFARLRIGIGPRPEKFPVRAFVLSGFNAREKGRVRDAVAAARDAALCWSEHGVDEAMERFNGRVGGQ